jgi:hypothetical protein
MGQMSLEFDRGRKLRALERAVLPKVVRLSSGKGISAKAMYAVLTALDKCARQADTCRVTLSDLSGLARLSEDHCGRTVQALELIFLLSVKRHFSRGGQEESEYRVIWGNLEALVQVAPGLLQTDLGRSQVALRSPPQTDPRSERYSKDLSSSKISKKSTTFHNTTAPPESASAIPCRDGGRQHTEPVVEGGGSFEWPGRDGWRMGWLSSEDFKGQEAVDRLFERMVAVGQGGILESDREVFYAILFCLPREKRQGKGVRAPLSVFRWLFSADRDRWILRPGKEDLTRARAVMESVR